MYIDALFNRDENIVQVVERVKGKRKFINYPVNYQFFVKNPKGKYRSIYDEPLERIRCKTYKDFQQQIKKHSTDKLYESDLNQTFVCLSENYMHADPPNLNICFWDIETDMQMFAYSSQHIVRVKKDNIEKTITVFQLSELRNNEYTVFDHITNEWVNINKCRYLEPGPGYSSATDALNPITAITFYLQWMDTLITLAVPPKIISIDEAKEITHDLPNTFICHSEAEMLELFLQLTEDVDIFSGWNCIPLSEKIWLHDRIVPLSSIRYKDKLYNSFVEHTYPINKKEIVEITLTNNSTIRSSKEHIFPIWYYPKNSYADNISLLVSDDVTVEKINEIMVENDVYLHQPLRKNTNEPLTFRKLITNNLDSFLEFGADFLIKDEEIVRKVSMITGKRSWDNKKYENWSVSKITSLLSRKEVLAYIDRSETIFMYNNKLNQSGRIYELDSIIPNEALWLLGMWFTDGTSSYKTEISVSNAVEDILLKCRDVFQLFRFDRASKPLEINRNRKDGCYLVRAGLSTVWWLKFFIYSGVISKSEKKLNVDVLSQLSHEQFLHFYGGCVDGDGTVTESDIRLCNFNNSIDDFSLLLQWNGFFNTINSNRTLVSTKIPNFENYLTHPVKKAKCVQLTKNQCSYNRISKTNIKRWFSDNNGFYVKITSINFSNEITDMMDVKTNTGYFIASGIETHNCSTYDIPYTINRITKILSKNDTKLMCLWEQYPKSVEIERYGKTHQSYNLVGKINLDYLELYRKYTYEEQSSYRLDYIGQLEVNESKTVYEGTLDQLYNNDFRKFIIYNRQDVALLNKLDQKLKFINTANALAHANTVLLPTTMGTVAVTEQAIINEAHELGYRIPSRNKKVEGESTQAAGAYVAYPKKGLHKWIGSFDINSLYPSTIRALNMGPETIFGQVRLDKTDDYIKKKMDDGYSFAAAWEGMFATLEYDMVMKNDPGIILTVDFADGNSADLSSAQIYNMIFDPKNKLMMSANATIFAYNKEGIIPGLLKKWYAERKAQQKITKNYTNLEGGIALPARFNGVF